MGDAGCSSWPFGVLLNARRRCCGRLMLVVGLLRLCMLRIDVFCWRPREASAFSEVTCLQHQIVQKQQLSYGKLSSQPPRLPSLLLLTLDSLFLYRQWLANRVREDIRSRGDRQSALMRGS